MKDMSREYDIYCEDCKKSSARGEWITDNISLNQCLKCGKIWVIKQTEIELEITGTTQQAWKDAERMAYQSYMV